MKSSDRHFSSKKFRAMCKASSSLFSRSSDTRTYFYLPLSRSLYFSGKVVQLSPCRVEFLHVFTLKTWKLWHSATRWTYSAPRVCPLLRCALLRVSNHLILLSCFFLSEHRFCLHLMQLTYIRRLHPTTSFSFPYTPRYVTLTLQIVLPHKYICARISVVYTLEETLINEKNLDNLSKLCVREKTSASFTFLYKHECMFVYSCRYCLFTLKLEIFFSPRNVSLEKQEREKREVKRSKGEREIEKKRQR